MADIAIEVADVRRYRPDADEDVIATIVKHYGIALRNPHGDAALLAASDASELNRFREKWARGRLGSSLPDDALDEKIADVLGEMTGDVRKRRVTASYLLAEKLGLVGAIGGSAGSVGEQTAIENNSDKSKAADPLRVRRPDLTGFAGRYVAIDVASDAVLADAATFTELVAIVRSEGLKATIVRAPRTDEPVVVGLG
jgi:hypothetical protein